MQFASGPRQRGNRFGMATCRTCLLMLVLLAGSLYGQARRLAVYDFDFKAVRSDVAQVYGSEKNVGTQVASRLISKLVNGRDAFDVIDRNQIDTILKEQNLKFSDRFDPRDAPKLGKLLNVDAIITGSIDQIAHEIQNNRVGIGPLALGKAQAVAEVTVSVRVISTETARIVMAEQVNNKHSHSLGRGGRVGNSSSDDGSASSHPEAVAANQALQGAADDIAAKILAKTSSLPVRSGTTISRPEKTESTRVGSPSGEPSPSVSVRPANVANLKVGRIENGKIYITGGENAGVKVNDYFEVRHVTGTMKDDQGNDIETDERVETIVISDVQEKFAVGKPAHSENSGAKVGDKLRKVKPPAPAKKATIATGGTGLPAPVQRNR